MKTLVVEDDLTSRILLQTYLERFGECHAVVSSCEALQAFHLASERMHPYDLVCVDIGLAGIDGMDLVRRLREHEERRGVAFSKGAKIFMTTALHDPETVFESFRSLCDEYLVKPIDIGRLAQCLRTHNLSGPCCPAG